MIQRLLLILCASLWLAGCPLSQKQVHITRQVSMALLPPVTLGKAISASQVFRSTLRRKKVVFYVQLEVEATRVVMVGLTPIGARLFTIMYQRGRVEYQPAPFFKAPLQPKHILADFQLTFWPLTRVKEQLSKGHLEVKEEAKHKRRIRRYTYKNGREVIRITYTNPDDLWKGQVHFHHLERGYTFSVKTVQVQALPSAKESGT